MIETWIAGVYTRHREHYHLVWGAFGGLVTQAFVQPFLPLIALTLGISAAEYPRFAGWFALSTAPTTFLAAAVAGRTYVEDVRRFSQTQTYDPATAWDQAVRAPWRNGAASFTASLPLLSVWPWIVRTEGFDGASLLAWYLLMGLTGLAVVASWLAGNRLFSTPVLAELATRHPEVVGTARQPSVATQLLLSTMAATTVGVVVGGGLATLSDAATTRALLLCAGIVATAVYTAVVFRVIAGAPIIFPLVELTAAARRVGDGDLDATVPITSEDELGRLSQAFNDMTTALRDRARLQAAFGSYVDPDLADRLLQQGDHRFDGQAVEATVLFLDVRDFTTYTDRHDATVVVAVLNRLFERVVPIIHGHGGHANKFLGDGLMAAFGTPAPVDDHADRAVAAALDIVAAVDEEFDGDLRIGVGLDTGRVVAGTLGGGGKLEFTLIGDAVNVAARVESQTKLLQQPLLLTDRTRLALRHTVRDFATIGSVQLPGKAVAVTLYAPATTTTTPDATTLAAPS